MYSGLNRDMHPAHAQVAAAPGKAVAHTACPTSRRALSMAVSVRRLVRAFSALTSGWSIAIRFLLCTVNRFLHAHAA